jgi:hypothetical protein
MPFPVRSVIDQSSTAPSVDAEHSWAGVSFVFEDAFWCDWLYREFDGLRVPRPLINRPSRHGLPYPDRLSVSPDPADPVQLENYAETLRTAQHLIVVVSPHSGRSELMQEHMRTFRAGGGEERIVALIVNGEPGSPTAEPASISDKKWMPPWLEWRFSEAGFAEAERTEPFVVDARMGVATLPEVRARLLAAMLEVEESRLGELGVVPRPATRANYPANNSESSPAKSLPVVDPPKGNGNVWLTATIAFTALCGLGGLALLYLNKKGGIESKKHAAGAAQLAGSHISKPEPQIISDVITATTVGPRGVNGSAPLVKAAPVPDPQTREFKSLTERRDRLMALAESHLEKGATDEAFEIFKQSSEIAAIAVKKSDSGISHLIRAAEIARRLGQIAFRVTSPTESREYFEKGRQFIHEARSKGASENDGAALLGEIEVGLQKLSAQ